MTGYYRVRRTGFRAQRLPNLKETVLAVFTGTPSFIAGENFSFLAASTEAELRPKSLSMPRASVALLTAPVSSMVTLTNTVPVTAWLAAWLGMLGCTRE